MIVLRIAISVLFVIMAATSAVAQDKKSNAATRSDYWWCRADDSKEAVRYLPGKAVEAPTQRQAAAGFTQALYNQYPNSSTGVISCGATSLLGYHDWVASNLTKESKDRGWKLAFVDVASQKSVNSSTNPKSAATIKAQHDGTVAGAVIGGLLAGMSDQERDKFLRDQEGAGQSKKQGSSGCSDLSPDVSDLTAKMDAVAAQGGAPGGFSAAAKTRYTIDQQIRECGGLSRCIELTRGQIQMNQDNLRSTDCQATRHHSSACELWRLNAAANQRVLDWMTCHQSR